MTPRIPREERREQLLDVALKIVAERGLDRLSMRSIAAEAGVGKPVLYRIFPSLAHLLLALVEREGGRTARALDALFPAEAGDRDARELLVGGLRLAIEEMRTAPLTWRLALFPSDDIPAELRRAVERRQRAAMRRTRRLARETAGGLGLSFVPDDEVLARAILAGAREYWRLLLLDPTMEPERLARSLEQLVELFPAKLSA